MQARYIALGILAFLHTGAAQAQGTQPQQLPYALKDESPPTGSSILRDRFRSNFPLDIPYAAMRPEAKSAVKDLYEPMPIEDEPPFPAAGLKHLLNTLYKGADRLCVVGDLIAVATISGEGVATSVKILASPDPDLSKFAAQVMMIEPYKPARCKGAPCTMEFPLRIHFDAN